MKFTKYRDWKDYHWKDYAIDSIYHKHADRVKRWVKGENILDIGAGDGLITSLIGAEGIENDEYALKEAEKHGVNVKYGTAYALKGKYDTVFLGDTLEHLEFPEKALKEIRKVLTGTLYITIPPKGNKCKFDYNEWNAKELTELVEKQGFKKVGKVAMANHRLYAKFKTN